MATIRHRVSAFAALGLLCVCSSPKQVHNNPSTLPFEQSDTSYYAVVINGLAGSGMLPEEIDFTRFRRSCFERGIPAPDAERATAFRTAIAEERWAHAALLGSDALSENFVDIRAHVYTAISHKRQGDLEQHRAHMFFASGMIHSIIDGHKGTSPDDAYHVYYVSNEYAVLEYLELRLEQQSLVTHGDRSYDRMTCRNAEGSEVVLYFDITEHMLRLMERMGE